MDTVLANGCMSIWVVHTKRVLKEVCQLGVPVWYMGIVLCFAIVVQGMDDIAKAA